MPSPLHCQAMPYAWGDLNAIQELTGHGEVGEPLAELWMGAHPKAPSTIADSGESLQSVIASDPERQLGDAASFGQLPFLFKVLAARTALSIQTHPSLDQARAGFAREESEGPAVDAATRTYRDANHKPELICALTPFAARVGFRPPGAVVELLDAVAATAVTPPIWSTWRSSVVELDEGQPSVDYRHVLRWLLTADDQDTAAMVESLTEAATSLAAIDADDAGRSSTNDNSLSLALEMDWIRIVAEQFPGDVGNLVAVMLNPVLLQPGQALYLPAGNLHAYLNGVGVELMANSDNVIRGGLTPKHIDCDELMEVVSGKPLPPEVQTPDAPTFRYLSGAPEFALTRVMGTHRIEHGPAIVLVTSGEASLLSDRTCSDGDASVDLQSGQVGWLAAWEAPCTLTASDTAWVATPRQ